MQSPAIQDTGKGCNTSVPDFDVDVQKANRMAALDWVCAAGRKSPTDVLMSCAEDCDVKDKQSRIPVDLVAGERSAAILDMHT